MAPQAQTTRVVKLHVYLAALCIIACSVAQASSAELPGYAVVASSRTHADPGWRKVIDTLVSKHSGKLITYDASVDECRGALQELRPRYACFVAQPEEAGREFVRRVHRLTRKLDEDPYADCFWGIVTGYDATNALRIARAEQPLEIRHAVAGTSIPLEFFEHGTWYSELKKNAAVHKAPGAAAAEINVPDDTTHAIAELLNSGAELFVTSGHATERDWQIGYAYRNGSFRCEHGELFGLDTQGRRIPVRSSTPKVYLAVGNCLMGHVDSPECMALAFLNSAGVTQMIGYTVNTWYGYAGWGCLDYFVEQPGRFTLAEAFLANQHALIHRISTYFPDLLQAQIDDRARTSAKISITPAAREAGLSAQDARGLLYDRDVLAFYGDPAWEARLTKSRDPAWEQKLSREGDTWTFVLEPRRGARSFALVDRNGSQRGGRPILHYFPHRLGHATLVQGAELKPVFTDDFILVPVPVEKELEPAYKVVFTAKPR